MARDEKLEHLLARVPLFARMGKKRARAPWPADRRGRGRARPRPGRAGRDRPRVLHRPRRSADGARRAESPSRTLGPGDFFGEIALLDSLPRTATVRAEGITRLLVIGHREFHALMDEFPKCEPRFSTRSRIGCEARRLTRLRDGGTTGDPGAGADHRRSPRSASGWRRSRTHGGRHAAPSSRA